MPTENSTACMHRIVIKPKQIIPVMFSSGVLVTGCAAVAKEAVVTAGAQCDSPYAEISTVPR